MIISKTDPWSRVEEMAMLPPIFAMMSLLGQEEVVSRLQKGYDAFDAIKNNA